MFYGKLEIGGPQVWPDDPDEDYLKLIILSPRFRAGLLVWYVQDAELWKALSEELGGSLPIEWLLTSKPAAKSMLDLRLGVLKSVLGGDRNCGHWEVKVGHEREPD